RRKASYDSYELRHELPHHETHDCLLKWPRHSHQTKYPKSMTRFSLNDSHFEEPHRGTECLQRSDAMTKCKSTSRLRNVCTWLSSACRWGLEAANSFTQRNLRRLQRMEPFHAKAPKGLAFSDADLQHDCFP